MSSFLASVCAGEQHGGAMPVLPQPPPPIPEVSPPPPPAAWSAPTEIDARLLELQDRFTGSFEPFATPGRAFALSGTMQYRGGLALQNIAKSGAGAAVPLAHGCEVTVIIASDRVVVVATESPVTGWLTHVGTITPQHLSAVATVEGARDELVLVCEPGSIFSGNSSSALDTAATTCFLRLCAGGSDLSDWVNALTGGGGSAPGAMVGVLRPVVSFRVDSGRVTHHDIDAASTGGGSGGQQQQGQFAVYRLSGQHGKEEERTNVERRFSEFESFHEAARAWQPNLMPRLPPKTWSTSLETSFIVDRAKQLCVCMGSHVHAAKLHAYS
jgi:hypothetical protein